MPRLRTTLQTRRQTQLRLAHESSPGVHRIGVTLTDLCREAGMTRLISTSAPARARPQCSDKCDVMHHCCNPSMVLTSNGLLECFKLRLDFADSLASTVPCTKCVLTAYLRCCQLPGSMKGICSVRAGVDCGGAQHKGLHAGMCGAQCSAVHPHNQIC